MEWAVSNMHYFYYPWEYFLEKQKAFGASQVDFYGCMPHIWIDHYTYSGCEKIKASLEEADLEMVLFTPKPYNYCLHAPDRYHGEQSEKYYQNCVYAAKALGVERISISLAGGYRDHPSEFLYEQALKRLQRLGDLAAEQGIRLLLEITGADDSPLLNSLPEMEALLSTLDSTAFAVLLNSEAVKRNGERTAQWMTAFKEKIQYIRFHNEIDWEVLQEAEHQGLWGVCVSDDEYWEAPDKKDWQLLYSDKPRGKR